MVNLNQHYTHSILHSVCVLQIDMTTQFDGSFVLELDGPFAFLLCNPRLLTQLPEFLLICQLLKFFYWFVQ